MEEEKKTIRIELTDEQKRLIQQETGKEAQAIELTEEEFEQRVTPVVKGSW